MSALASTSMSLLNTDKLTAYLRQQNCGIDVEISAEKFAVGQSNPTFLLQSGKQRYVLRRKPPGELLKSAHAVDREFRVMKALQDSQVPVPRMVHLCEDTSIIGSMFYVMEYVPGRTFWNAQLPKLAPDKRQILYDNINRVLAAIHSMDIHKVGLGDYGKTGNYFERQIKRWSTQYQASETENLETMNNLLSWLPANLPVSKGQFGLVHGDYRLDNLIFHPEQMDIVAVVDWELSTLGNPIADLAAQCAQWRYPVDWVLPGFGDLDRETLGLPDEAAYIEAYCDRRGLSDIPHWDYYIAFSFFRMACILQGVKKRALEGNASSDRAFAMGELVEPLAQMACDTLAQY